MLMLVLLTGRITPPSRPALRWGRWAVPAGLVLMPIATMRTAHSDTIYLMIYQPYAGMTLATMRALFDFDRDGYSAFFGGGDCAPFNAEISPGHVEIPLNGIDDNCLRGDAKAPLDRAALQEKVAAPADHPSMSVVLITIDTLRPDRMSLYGHDRPTTPSLERIAKTGVRFDRAYTAGGWTSISLSSMLRGVFPRRLTWNTLYETNKYRLLRSNERNDLMPGETVKLAFGMPIEEKLKPLAWWLKRRGMHTAAIIDDGYSQFLDQKYMREGFDEYKEVEKLLPNKRDDVGTADLAIDTIEKMPQGEPFFLWTHFFGPHGPSVKHEGTRYWGEKEPDGYDHEILFVDNQIRRVLATLTKKMGIDPYVVIITSDHGEKIRTTSHRDHGSDLEEESIRVPLIITGVGFPAGKTSDAVVSLVDLFPTILAATNTPAPEGLDGIDLAPIVNGQREMPERTLIAETWRLGPDRMPLIDMLGAYNGQQILMLDRVNNLSVTKTQSKVGGPGGKTLYGVTTAPELRNRLEEYIEETGGVIRMIE
ncbi:MAG: sulfatase-like hydrolase/transferase [Polyangiaceae bacterium]